MGQNDDDGPSAGEGEGLAAFVRAAFGWRAEVTVSAGPRGALGQVWRLQLGSDCYALKEIFADPSPPALIEAELLLAGRAAAAGVRLPASHPDLRGDYLLTTPSGKSLRLYDWVDLRPLDLTAADAPAKVGALLARLHRSAPAAQTEPGGDPPSAWYDHTPAPESWADALASGASWASLLAERVSTLPQLCADVTPAEPGALLLCHRDLHPENVLADPDGNLVVVDWDDVGPAAPAREIAAALFDWFCPGPVADPTAMAQMYAAYLDAGGPGLITGPADFSMLLAARLNFLLLQTRIALDPAAEQRHRQWAEREIEEALQILPAPGQLAAALALARKETARRQT